MPSPSLPAAHVAACLALYVAANSELKSVADLVRGYVDDITRDFQDALDGDLLTSECRRRHRAYIKRDAEAVFIEGLKAGGVPEAELDAEDLAVIAAWVAAQQGYVNGLWDAVDKLADDFQRGLIKQPEFVAQRRDLYTRIGLWGQSLRDLGSAGKASALANMMVTWRLGATEKHCRTCARLNGKRKRLKWFTSRGYYPQQNGSETLECGGWRCECTLRDDKGKQVLPA